MDKDDFEVTSAAAQVADPNSVRAFWKRCIAYRKEHDVLVYSIDLACLSKLTVCFRVDVRDLQRP